MVPPGQVHTLQDGGLRTAGASWETTRRLSRCCFFFFFHSACCDRAAPLFPPFLSFQLSPPSISILSLQNVSVPRPFFGFFLNVAGLCRLLCLEPLEHTVELQSVAKAGFTAAFSLSVPPRNLHCRALALSLSASALFVFSHGLLSQPRVSLIINDPKGDRPLVALEVLDPTA